MAVVDLPGRGEAERAWWLRGAVLEHNTRRTRGSRFKGVANGCCGRRVDPRLDRGGRMDGAVQSRRWLPVQTVDCRLLDGSVLPKDAVKVLWAAELSVGRGWRRARVL